MAFNITPASILSGVNQVGGFISRSARIDVVQVINQETLEQVFAGARPVRASVRETARVMDYPVETGSTISDHRISNPTEIELIVIIPSGQYSSSYPDIRNAWLNATLLSVQTRLGTYRNMIISDLPHDEDPDMFSAVTLSIRLREVILVAPVSIAPTNQKANFAPANPEYTSTVNSGLIAALAAPGSVLSYFHAASVWGGKL